MFSITKARDRRNFSRLCRRHVLALDGTYLNKFALSAKLCVSGLKDDLSNIDEYFFFVSSAVTTYVPF